MHHLDTSHIVYKNKAKANKQLTKEINEEIITCITILFEGNHETQLSNVEKHFIRKNILYVYTKNNGYLRTDLSKVLSFYTFKAKIIDEKYKSK